jgi:hypothetical protein
MSLTAMRLARMPRMVMTMRISSRVKPKSLAYNLGMDFFIEHSSVPRNDTIAYWSDGVMERWSVGCPDYQYSITPVLHIPRLIITHSSALELKKTPLSRLLKNGQIQGALKAQGAGCTEKATKRTP